jgi:integrase
MIVESRFDAEGKRSRVAGWEAMRVDRALTAKVFNDFKNGWLRSVPQNEVAMDRAKRSVNSYINFARSIFGKDFLPLYEGLGLPDLGELRGVKLYRKTGDTRFKQIPPVVLLAMENEIRAMREERPDWYLAFYLMRELGMRREEVTQARLEWIQESDEGMEMAITKRAYYTPKGTEGFLLISPELMQDIHELSDARKPLDYLIPAGSDCGREKSIHRKMSKWVRKHLGRGRRSNKTLHELRKQAISEVLETTNGNWQKTLEFSRHADIDTLINSYSAVISERPMLRRVGALRVLPDLEPKQAAG